MARRRFASKRSQPDRGWVVGRNEITLVNSTSPQSDFTTFFDFADIDAEALTGRIEADKSDWFIKRFICDIYASVSFSGVGPTDVARIYSIGLGVIDTPSANTIVNADDSVISPEAYNSWARLFWTGVKPVYAGGILPSVQNSGEPSPGLHTEGYTTGTSTLTGWSTTAPFWGPSGYHLDMPITNAGLRNNQVCGAFVHLEDGPSNGFNWDSADTLYLSLTYRVLMQKRR